MCTRRFEGSGPGYVLTRQRWETREVLRPSIVHYIEATYHRRRCKLAGKLTTIEFERIQELGATAPQERKLTG